MRRREIGPQRFGEPQLRIGALPEEKVGKPLLPAGADNKVGIGQTGGIEMLELTGVVFNPLTGTWSRKRSDMDVNYMGVGCRPAQTS